MLDTTAYVTFDYRSSFPSNMAVAAVTDFARQALLATEV